MTIYISIAFGFIIGWATHVYSNSYRNYRVLVTTLDEIEQIQRKKIKNLIPLCYIDKSDDMYYLYNKETSKFYCQASTYSELATKLYDIGVSIACIKHQKETLWFVDGRVEESYIENT